MSYFGNSKDDSFDESLKKILEMAADDVPPKKPVSAKQNENLHEGHRQRVYESASKDALLDTFSDVEALEYVLFAALPRVNTNEIAHRLLNAFGSLDGVFAASIKDLEKIRGMSQRVAYFLKAIPAIARKSHLSRVKPETIKSIPAALDYLKIHFEYIYTECMYVMSLDLSDRLLGVDCVTALGTATSNTISLAGIIDSVCRHHASKIIIAHNHPGGVMQPSHQDIATTDMVIDSLAAMDVVLVDHLIFTPEDCYLSFFNSGLISMMYKNFDNAHNTHLSDLLPSDVHSLSSRTEYIFDIKSASAMRKDDYDRYFDEEARRNMLRTDWLRDFDPDFLSKIKK